MRGVGGVLAPPGGQRTPEESEGGASDQLRTAMEEMEVGGDDMENGKLAKQEDAEEEGGRLGGRGGGVLELEATGILTQDVELGGTTLVDAHNSFNELIRIVMLWTALHHCLEGARFTFNCYRHWALLFLHQHGDA